MAGQSAKGEPTIALAFVGSQGPAQELGVGMFTLIVPGVQVCRWLRNFHDEPRFCRAGRGGGGGEAQGPAGGGLGMALLTTLQMRMPVHDEMPAATGAVRGRMRGARSNAPPHRVHPVVLRRDIVMSTSPWLYRAGLSTLRR